MPPSVAADPASERLRAFGTLLGRAGKVIESEVSGTSMGNTLPSGRHIRIVPLPVQAYRAGQVVAYFVGSTVFAHRIVFCSRAGVLTRGDSHNWCDLPIAWSAILGVVSEHFVAGQWLPFDENSFLIEMRMPSARFEPLLCVCMRFDLRLTWHASRILMSLARWRRRLVVHRAPNR
jgi:hypothetical protein